MADPAPRAHRDQLHYSAVLPVAWASRARDEDPLTVSRRHRRNLAALALDSAAGERPSDETGAAELLRLDAKLNAIMELLATLHERDVELLPAVPLRFNAHGIEWKCDAPPEAASPLVVRIHLEAAPALPLELAATALVLPEPGWAAARFEGVKAPLAEAIARMVFREHRRQVADSAGNDK
ncbi:MAG TPA: PilZ domain-containing protein [Rhodanobacteraceae bacterium]|nr:PilZ domain-containing protein [Rhodanobacteraceae bacterium]